MKRISFNFWIDLLSFLVFFLLVFTGLLIYYVLPPCENCTGNSAAPGVAQTLWGLDRHAYGDVHFYLSLLTVGLMVLHVALHWSWVCTTCCRLWGMKNASPDQQNRYGILFLSACVLVMIGILYWAKLQAR
jgi:hypothetical protein